MPTIITTEALPNNTLKVNFAFTDEDGNAVTPNDPTTWTLKDSQGNTINSRSAVAIVEDTSIDVVLSSSDLAATGVYDDGIRIISISGTYDSTAGSDLSLNADHWFVIGDNIKPVSLADAKRHCEISSTDTTFNVKLAELITSAREHVETITNRKLLTQTVTHYFDSWPDGNALPLPYGKLQSVTSVTYRDTDGDWNTFSSDSYTVETAEDPGRIVLNYGESWPSDALHPSKPIKVIFVCGYGSTPGSVPASIRTAIMIMVAGNFEQREPFFTGMNYRELPIIDHLLWSYRLWGALL